MRKHEVYPRGRQWVMRPVEVISWRRMSVLRMRPLKSVVRRRMRRRTSKGRKCPPQRKMLLRNGADAAYCTLHDSCCFYSSAAASASDLGISTKTKEKVSQSVKSDVNDNEVTFVIS